MSVSTLLGTFILPAIVFALAYFPVVTRLSRGLLSPYPKADVRRRLLAASIDGFTVVMSGLLLLDFGLRLVPSGWLRLLAVPGCDKRTKRKEVSSRLGRDQPRNGPPVDANWICKTKPPPPSSGSEHRCHFPRGTRCGERPSGSAIGRPDSADPSC